MGDIIDTGRRSGAGAVLPSVPGLGASQRCSRGAVPHSERSRGARACGRTRPGGVEQIAVDLLEEALDELGVGGVLAQIDDPAALAAHASAAYMEDLHGSGELVARQGEDVGVGSVGQDDGIALDDLSEGVGVIAQAGGLLELQILGGQAHALLELA